jgi:hypothetical protein
MSKTLAELESENAALRQQLADLQIEGALEPMALKHRVRADGLEDVQNRYRRAFPSGHKSAEELENFFTGLPRYPFDPGTAYHKDAEHKDTQGGPITANPFLKATLNLTQQARLLKESPERFAAMKAEAIAKGEWNPRD